MSLKDFESRVVLITGGATGIGRATALAFAKRGAKVVIGDVNEQAKETVEMIKQEGAEALFKKTDVTNSSDVKGLIDFAVEQFGGLDHAFNNAGVLPPTKDFADMTEEDFDFVVNVDLKGVFYAMKHEVERHSFLQGCLFLIRASKSPEHKTVSRLQQNTAAIASPTFL